MTSETTFRITFVILLLALLAMRIYFMIKVRRSGGRLTPDDQAVEREGGRGVFFFRVVFFLVLISFLGMYIAGAEWFDAFSIPLPAWLRWSGFILGICAVMFWSWAQIHLDTQWSAQLQLIKNHRLVTTGPYARIRHPLYLGMMVWGVSVALLTANWIFIAVCVLAIAGVMWRVPKEEQMMLENFGDEYKAFIRNTGRFFPKI